MHAIDSYSWVPITAHVTISTTYTEYDADGGSIDIAIFRYNYSVNGFNYSSYYINVDGFTNDFDPFFFPNGTFYFVNHYPVNSSIQTYFNPHNPSESAIIPGLTYFHVFFISAFLLFILLIILSFYLSLFKKELFVRDLFRIRFTESLFFFFFIYFIGFIGILFFLVMFFPMTLFLGVLLFLPIHLVITITSNLTAVFSMPNESIYYICFWIVLFLLGIQKKVYKKAFLSFQALAYTRKQFFDFKASIKFNGYIQRWELYILFRLDETVQYSYFRIRKGFKTEKQAVIFYKKVYLHQDLKHRLLNYVTEKSAEKPTNSDSYVRLIDQTQSIKNKEPIKHSIMIQPGNKSNEGDNKYIVDYEIYSCWTFIPIFYMYFIISDYLLIKTIIYAFKNYIKILTFSLPTILLSLIVILCIISIVVQLLVLIRSIYYGLKPYFISNFKHSPF